MLTHYPANTFVLVFFNDKFQSVQTLYKTKLSHSITFSTFSDFDTSRLFSLFWFQTSEKKCFLFLRYLSLIPRVPSAILHLKSSRISNKNFADFHPKQYEKKARMKCLIIIYEMFKTICPNV